MDQNNTEVTEVGNITNLEAFRRQLHAGFAAGAAQAILGPDGHKPTYMADQARQYVDTVIVNHVPDALIPVHIPHPLRSNTLTKIARNGVVSRTVKIETEEFFPYDDAGRNEALEEALIAEGEGELQNPTWKMVGFSDGGKYIYLEVTGTYVAPTKEKAPRGRRKTEKEPVLAGA